MFGDNHSEKSCISIFEDEHDKNGMPVMLFDGDSSLMCDTAGFPDLNTGCSLKLKENDSGDELVGRVSTTEGLDIFDGEVWNQSDNREQEEKSLIRANPEEEYFRLVSFPFSANLLRLDLPVPEDNALRARHRPNRLQRKCLLPD